MLVSGVGTSSRQQAEMEPGRRHAPRLPPARPRQATHRGRRNEYQHSQYPCEDDGGVVC